jgi:hypothetical protein
VSDRLTLATSTGLPLLSLVFHVGTGVIALVAGFIAVSVRKGGTRHRRSGIVFVYAMIATAIAIAGISAYEGKPVTGGVFIIYLVFTAYTAVKPLPGPGRWVDTALMALAFTFAVGGYARAFTAFGRPGSQINGVPAGMMFFMATIILLAAVGDLRMILAGGIEGSRRLARHLWRMSFALFIASGSFAAQLAGMKFIPAPIRSVPVIAVLAVSPLVVLLYWMWRIRLNQNLRGMMTVKPAAPLEALN